LDKKELRESDLKVVLDYSLGLEALMNRIQLLP
jgi:hypothetical protein